MANEEKALAAPIEVAEGGMVLRTMADLAMVSESIHRSGMAPKSLDSAAKVSVAILTGAEAGLSPMMAVRSIYVVHGSPAWLTKAARALVNNSGLLRTNTSIQEGVIHTNDCPHGIVEGKRCTDQCYGFCRTHRKNEALAKEHKFYVHEAKAANLWKKTGPWQEYPTRMLMHRAAGFHFDDCWSDVLMGLNTVEVVKDYPQAAFVRDGDTVATYAEPPGRDPLLPPATGGATIPPDGVKEAAGETVVEATSEANDRAEDSAASEDTGLVLDEMICAHNGCGIIINPDTDVRWKVPNGWHCADCGPPQKEKT